VHVWSAANDNKLTGRTCIIRISNTLMYSVYIIARNSALLLLHTIQLCGFFWTGITRW